MRIIQVITELKPAGAERILANLSLGLKEKGHEVIVVSLRPLPANMVIIAELKRGSIPVYSLELGKLCLWRMFRLKKIIAEFRPDVLHSHLLHANIVCRLNSFRRKYKLINTVHIAERRKSCWWHFLLDKLTLSLCDCQTAVSQAVRDFHSRRLGIQPDKMPVIYNGIHAPKKLSGGEIEKLKNEWGIKDCQKVIGSVGRLDWQKGYDLLLKLLPELSKRIPSVEKWAVLVLGEGGQERNWNG